MLCVLSIKPAIYQASQSYSYKIQNQNNLKAYSFFVEKLYLYQQNKMELQNESHTPHFIKTVNYHEDYVQNSLQMGHGVRTSANSRDYRSPGRASYQAKYPASFAIEKDHMNGNPGRYSPPKHNSSPAEYSSSNNIPANMSNRNPTIEIPNTQPPYPNQQYPSPSHNYANQFMPSPYVSPSNHNSNYSSYNNYASSHNNTYSSPHNLLPQQLSSQSNSRSIIQLEKLVSELKISLQQSISTLSSLQDQLNKQKTRSFELSQNKRKLEEELRKMEFQLDRITNIDFLGQRQLIVKYEAQILENQRLNSQLNDTTEELKRIKTQCRDLMSENTKIREDCELLKKNNADLANENDALGQDVATIKYQWNESTLRERQLQLENQHLSKSQLNNQANGAINQNQFIQNEQQKMSSAHLNSIHTTRTDNYDSAQMIRYGNTPLTNSQLSQNGPRFKSPQKQTISHTHLSPKNKLNPHQGQYINYELENSKLVDDYNKLQMENDAMKKLYKEFYQHSPKKVYVNSPPSCQRSISEHSEEFESSNPNFYPRNHHDHDENIQNSRLQTFQKNELYSQISSLRQEVINELMIKHFTQALQEAQNKKVNVLIVFIKLLTKDIHTVQKMVINYLQARDILKKELNVKRLTEGEEGKPTTQFEVEAEGMWENVKEKLKSELKSHQKGPSVAMNHSEVATLNINAYFLALFRLLTLVQKYQSKFIESYSKTLAKIKHSSLKYVHKIHEETQKIRIDSDSHKQQNHKHGQKVSLRK